MDALLKVRTLIITTLVVWLCVLGVSLMGGAEFVRGAAAILAVISTMTLWSLWALDEYGISIDGTPHEKPKRDAGSADDPRLALLLSLLTPDQREALQSRLMEDLDADGENLSLAELLAEQTQQDPHRDHSS